MNQGESTTDKTPLQQVGSRTWAQQLEDVIAERGRYREALTEVGKWMSGGDFTGYENVLARIEKVLADV